MTTTAGQQQILQAIATHAETVKNAARIDKSYTRAWNKLKQCVDQEHTKGVLAIGEKYLTRENVDFYFSTVVSESFNLNPDSARRVVAALQKYSDLEEHALAAEPFVVDSPIVKKALASHKVKWFESQAMKSSDPHENLPTNSLTYNDHGKVLHYYLQNNRQDWKEACLMWTINRQTYLRYHNTIRLSLSRLRLDEDSGPRAEHLRRDAPCAPSLHFIMQKREMAKNQDRGQNSKSDITAKVVGVVRHEQNFQCCIGFVAFSLFFQLYSDRSVNFLAPTDGRAPEWWGKSLFKDWSAAGYETCRSSFNRATLANNISWAKVTHLRKAGMDEGGKAGVNPDTLASMSKHNASDKISRYIPQTSTTVMKAMAGFRMEEAYYIPRSEILFPDWTSLEDVIRRVFPCYPQWQLEHQHFNGDRSEAAQNFLGKLIPFFATVVFQDGIYWVEKYKTHEATMLLLKVMPPQYERWAAATRAEVLSKTEGVSSLVVDRANLAMQNAFSHVAQSLLNLDQKMDKMVEEVKEMRRSVSQRSLQEADVTVLPAQEPHQNALTQLRNTPLIPSFSIPLPKSMVEILHEHDEIFDLEKYRHTRHSLWSKALKLAWCKRIYLYDCIVKKADRSLQNTTHQEKKEKAASDLDLLRGLMSLDQFLKYLKSNDPGTKKRKCS